MADSDSISSIDGLDAEQDDEQTNEQKQSKTLPILAFTSLLLKEKITELSDIPNTYNLYLIHQVKPTEWNLYLFIKDPSDIKQLIELSNNDILRHIVTVSEHSQNSSTTEYFLEQLLNTTQEKRNNIEKYTFHLKDDVKDGIQGLLNRFTIQASSETIQDFNLSLGIVKSLYLDGDTSGSGTVNTGILDTRFVNALRKVIPQNKQSELNENNYKYFTNQGGNDCFFLSLAQAYVKSNNQQLKRQLKERMNLSDTTDINTIQTDIRNFIASNVNEGQYRAFKERNGDTINAEMRDRVNSLEDYQKEIRSSAYQADELTIGILIKHDIFPFSVELNTENENAIVKCTSYLDKPTLQELEKDNPQDSSKNMIYFMLQYTPSTNENSNHYELVGYEETPSNLKTLFLYNQLPNPIQSLVAKNCAKPQPTQQT